jgi:hypothetical protein
LPRRPYSPAHHWHHACLAEEDLALPRARRLAYSGVLRAAMGGLRNHDPGADADALAPDPANPDSGRDGAREGAHHPRQWGGGQQGENAARMAAN